MLFVSKKISQSKSVNSLYYLFKINLKAILLFLDQMTSLYFFNR